MTETPAGQTFECRIATSDDEAGIWKVLVEVAPDIPARVSKPEDQENLKDYISEWVGEGSSLVAVDSNSVIIGFILSRLANYNTLDLPYIGVSKGWQQRGVLTSLLAKIKAKGKSLIASVLFENKSNMDAILEKAGFVKQSRQDPKQVHLRWDSPNATQANKA